MQISRPLAPAHRDLQVMSDVDEAILSIIKTSDSVIEK